MSAVVIGMIGSGFAARLHCEAYARVCGMAVRLKRVASLDQDVEDFAKAYGFAKACRDYRQLLDDPEIDVVDIILPPALHRQCILEALAAGKHVICEKPFTGYFGEAGDQRPVGLHVPRETMESRVHKQLAELRSAVEESGKLFCYAENWVYAPGIQKIAEGVRKKEMRQLFIKAEESHSGSHAPHAAYWSQNGGGSLIRQGCHPLTAVLYLKEQEARARGEQISVTSVTADTAGILSGLDEEEKRHFASRPVDVEDLAVVSMGFSDGTRALVIAGDMVLGGVRNYVEVYGNSGALLGNLSPNNALETYFVEEEGLEDFYITEKTSVKTGWQKVFLDEITARGYVGELQDFMECVRDGRQPECGLDLAVATTEIVYAAYRSAQEQRSIRIQRT